ncbi:MAG: cytochrome c [Saprospiraceae bacterium]
MRFRYLPLLTIFSIALGAWGFHYIPATAPLDGSISVEKLAVALGAPPAPHQVRTDVAGVSVEAGKMLVTQGIANIPGKGASRRQSVHFVCTSCHNIQKEDPNLAVSDPEARLNYAIANDLPFLPGTTLYGVVNRRHFYNGDYEKKYGDLVRPARNDLRGAIALCATECAQGRELADWEMESILAYLWTIDLKIADLQLTDAEQATLQTAYNAKQKSAPARQLLESKYLDHAPATFLTPPPDRKTGYEGITGNAANGQRVYEKSCLHCHGERRYSFFNLDTSDFSKQFLAKHFPVYTRYSTYQVVRYGTSPMNGKKAYMPHYTQERMSNQQVEDLKAFVFDVK